MVILLVRGRFIQDATGGISSYGGGVDDLNPGDFVALTGEVSEFNGLLQISPVNELELISSDNALPSAEMINTSGINEENESTLVSVSGVTFTDAGGMFASNGTYEISDANGTSVIFVRSNHPFVGTEIPAGEVDMTGVVGQYNDHQLLARDFDDVSWESTTQPPVETITIAAARSMV